MNFYSTYECPHKETHIAVTKESTVTETGEESIICSECGTVLEKRIVPRKQSPKEMQIKLHLILPQKKEIYQRENKMKQKMLHWRTI